VKPDISLFPDVADKYGISSPSIVEKDYYAVQLLKTLQSLSFETYELVFAGGTSLAKAYKNTFRMSEDIDIKLVAVAETTKEMSRSSLRKERGCVIDAIKHAITGAEGFEIIDCLKRNECRFFQALIAYPRKHEDVAALRPHLQLDVTDSLLWTPPEMKAIGSLLTEAQELQPEIESFPCVSIASTASEKLVSLLRRTAFASRDAFRKDDNALIRHAYDLHIIQLSDVDHNEIRDLVARVVETDAAQFGSQHPEFRSNPFAELRYGLECLHTNPVHRSRYDQFIGPLVYHENPATWDEALATVSELAQQWLPKI